VFVDLDKKMSLTAKPCVGEGDLFFPPDDLRPEGINARRSREEIAKAICDTCPVLVRKACRESAIRDDIAAGLTGDVSERDQILGGMNFLERSQYVDDRIRELVEFRAEEVELGIN